MKYVRSDRDDKDRSPSPKKRDQNEKRCAVINTIFDGPNGRQFGNKRKALIREAQHEVNTSFIRPAVAITFIAEHSKGVHLPHNDALIISPLIDNVRVKRVLVDGGAATNILSLSTYLAMGWEISQLNQCPTPLVGFSGRTVYLHQMMK
ncbi:uncharacterized protein LOC111018264 [Momordica charantia]|uniref:Uncharacterized protein LOC111018264 n=1 Tax=Momordica charantia TaxID=3673 RepID=A0A6J1D783_MOMCH|nr:uncharacterized protein LOC111018264 [Momordica charantia]